MEIRFYDREMDFLGVMENQTSLIWIPKYSEPGAFELYAPITADNLRKTVRGNLVTMRGREDAAVIEDRILEENSTRNQITAKGRFLSSYMERRLIKGTVNFSGKAEVAMRQLLSSVSPIPRVELGELQGFEETVSFQATYKNLLTYQQKLARSAGLGFRFRPDFDRKKIFFEVYRGTDRSGTQGFANRVTFSESYNNLNNAVYRETDLLYRNVAYVGGEGQGADRTIVQIGEGSGLDLREIFVDAKDIRKEELTDVEYAAALRTRGEEKLTEAVVSDSFECDTGADVNFRYQSHYELGDLVMVKKKAWGIATCKRITEVREVYEYGGRRIEPTLGDGLPDKIDWSDT